MAISNPLIIVVDDDAAVRNSLKFSLEVDGFAVRTCASAEELLCMGDLRACECLITDQNMPGTTGLELVAVLRRQGIEVPAILISAHVTTALSRHASGAGIPVVEKPFLGQRLTELIYAAIGAKSN